MPPTFQSTSPFAARIIPATERSGPSLLHRSSLGGVEIAPAFNAAPPEPVLAPFHASRLDAARPPGFIRSAPEAKTPTTANLNTSAPTSASPSASTQTSNTTGNPAGASAKPTTPSASASHSGLATASASSSPSPSSLGAGLPPSSPPASPTHAAAAQAAQVTAAMLAEMTARFDRAFEQFMQVNTTLAAQARQDAVDLAFMLAQRLLQRTLSDNTEDAARLVRSTLSRARDARAITLRLSPTDAKRLNTQNLEVDTSVTKVKIIADENLDIGDCIVDTEIGCIDGRIMSQLAAMRQNIQQTIQSAPIPSVSLANDSDNTAPTSTRTVHHEHLSQNTGEVL